MRSGSWPVSLVLKLRQAHGLDGEGAGQVGADIGEDSRIQIGIERTVRKNREQP